MKSALSLSSWQLHTIERKGKYKKDSYREHIKVCAKYLVGNLPQAWQVGHRGRLHQGSAADLGHEESVRLRQTREAGECHGSARRETILLKVLSLKGAVVSQEMKNIPRSKHKGREGDDGDSYGWKGRQRPKKIMQDLFL